MKKVITILLFSICSSSYGQNLKKIDSLLRITFRNDSIPTGNWAYYQEKANLRIIDKSEIQSIIPNFTFLQVNLTYYLGWHSESPDCLLLYDSSSSKIKIVEPLWYSDQNKWFLKLFIGHHFLETKSLMKFVRGLQELLLIGSGMKFTNTKNGNSKITYDLIERGKKGIWRKCEIILENNTIKMFVTTNPKTQEAIVVK